MAESTEIGKIGFLLFPHCFQKICNADTEKQGLVVFRRELILCLILYLHTQVDLGNTRGA